MYHADLLSTLGHLLGGSSHLLWNVRASTMDMEKYPWTSGAVRRACVWLSRVPDAVVFNSVAGRSHHELLGYRPRRSLVIPNGLDVSVFRPDEEASAQWRARLGLRDSDVLIGMLARVDEMKDHATFLAAAERVARGHDDVHFVLAGQGVSADVEPFRRAAGILGARLHLLGFQEDVPGLTAALDLATLVSRGEGFPNVVVEAMACGVPCVVTDVGDAPAVLGEAGLVVPARDPSRLASAWRQLRGMGRQGRQLLGAVGRARVIGHYTLGHVATAYADLYRSVVPTSPPAARSPA
jgi:glycosyltransferase involved in cell wall biosynthesis